MPKPPFDMSQLSPTPWPPAVGTLAITLQHPRGYVVTVRTIIGPVAEVAYLDSIEGFTLPLDSLIPTGKTPESLCTPYALPPIEWDRAVDLEMSFPDFSTQPKRKAASPGRPKSKVKINPTDLTAKLKAMTPAQKAKLGELFKSLLK